MEGAVQAYVSALQYNPVSEILDCEKLPKYKKKHFFCQKLGILCSDEGCQYVTLLRHACSNCLRQLANISRAGAFASPHAKYVVSHNEPCIAFFKATFVFYASACTFVRV